MTRFNVLNPDVYNADDKECLLVTFYPPVNFPPVWSLSTSRLFHFSFCIFIPLHTSLSTSHHLIVTIDRSLLDNSLFIDLNHFLCQFNHFLVSVDDPISTIVQCCLAFQIQHVYLFPALMLASFYHNQVHHLHFFVSHPFTPLLRQPTVLFC